MSNTPVPTLILGSEGQLGSELRRVLLEQFPPESLLCTDLKAGPSSGESPFEHVDVLDEGALKDVFERFRPQRVYLLAAMLSASGEARPKDAWKLNMEGLLRVLDLSYRCRSCFLAQFHSRFWPRKPQSPGGTSGLHGSDDRLRHIQT